MTSPVSRCCRRLPAGLCFVLVAIVVLWFGTGPADARTASQRGAPPFTFTLDAASRIRQLEGIVTGSITIGGAATTVTLASGDDANITFSGTAGQQLGLALSGVTIGTSACCSTLVSVLKPDGSMLQAPSFFGTDGGTRNLPDLPTAGTYTIVIDPQGTDAGSVTLTLSEDTTTTVAIGGSTSTASTSRIGQNARVTFNGTAGQFLGLALTNVTLGASGCCSAFVSVLKPDGSMLKAPSAFGTSGGTINIPVLPATGTYTIFLDPYELTATGSVTLTLSEDAAGTVAIGGASTTVTMARVGQNARVTFSGTAGQPLQLVLSNVTVGTSGCCSSVVSVLNPDGSTLKAPVVFGTSGSTIALPALVASGTHTIFLEPYPPDLTTGSVTVALVQSAFQQLAQTYGTCSGFGTHALAPSVCSMDPVNSLTGAFTASETDLALASKGLELAFRRSYTSADATSGRLGPGWTDDYAVSLAIQPNGDAILHGDEGQQVLYTKQPDGSFRGAAGALSTLTAIAGGYKLVRKDQVAYTFDSGGVLQGELDRNGQGLSFSYTSGKLTSITDSAGHTVSLGYNASNLLGSVATPDGRTVSYGYTGGRLTSVTLPDPDGPGPLAAPVTNYSYDAGGRLATVVDANNHTQVTNVYDPSSGRVTQQTDARGKTTSFAWDQATQTATVTDANNHVWKDVYANNILVKRIDATSKTTVFDHDGGLDTTSVTSPDGSSTTSMSYDSAGNLLTATAPVSLGSVQKTFSYDAQNNVRTVTDARSKQTVYGYDAAGNLTSVSLDGQAVAGATYNAQGQMLTSSDGNGKTTTYTYDANGNVASVTAPDPDGAGPLAAPVTTYTYDSIGNALTRVEPLGNCSGCTPADYRTTYTYDKNGHRLTETDPLGNTTTHVYDAASNETSVTDANNHTTTYEYDNANHLTKVTGPDPDGGGPLTAPITTYSYDDAGNRVSEVDPRGNVPGGNPSAFTTTYAYDANNRLASVTTPKGEKTTYTYDANGNRATMVDPRGNVQGANPDDYKTSYGYDAAGRLLTTTDPLGNVTTNHYDGVGNLDWTKDANNHQTSYSYDAAGRLLTITAPDGGLTTYTYDANGNVKTQKDDNNHIVMYSYDDDGRLTQITGPDPDGAGPQTAPVTTYTYDLNGNRTSLVDPNGNATQTAGDGKTTYTYDRVSRLKTVGYSDTTPGVTFNYDPVGNRSSMVDGSGTVTYTYDALDRLTSLTRGTNTFSYAYDASGNVTSRTYPDSTQTSYGYDEDNRLTSAASGGNTTGYAYDPASNLTQTTLPSGNGYVETRTYDRARRLVEVKNANGAGTLSDFVSTLDAVGNPTQVVQSGAVASTTTYTYDPNDRLSSVCFQAGSCPGGSDPFIRWSYDKVGNRLTEARPTGTTNSTHNGLDELTQAGPTGYSYDQNGNETAAGSRTFSYDLANRLKTTTSGSTTTTYTYDGDGVRLQASTGTQASKKTNLLWDTNQALPQLALERDGNNTLLRRYVYGERRISMTTGGNAYYYHYDALGSVRNLTSATGVTQWTDSYEPYGAIRTETQNATGAPTNPIKFAGEYQDPTGLYHLRARQYETVNGRFLTRDPAVVDQRDPYASSYAYAGDRPSVMVDPSGRTFEPAGIFLNVTQQISSLNYIPDGLDEASSAYVNPFRLSRSLVPKRIDMGVDYNGRGPIAAIGNALIIGDGGNGWPGKHYLLYKLTNGNHAGRYIYVAEAISPRVRAGQHVKAGQIIADFGPNAAPGRSPGIEIGWSSPTLNLTYAKATTGYREGQVTPAGRAFARLLKSVGAPVRDNPGPGPTFPR